MSVSDWSKVRGSMLWTRLRSVGTFTTEPAMHGNGPCISSKQ